MPRPCAYAGWDIAEAVSVELHGVSERQEQYNAVWVIRRAQIQVLKQRYYVDKAGKNTSRIAEYIKKLKEDQLGKQLTMNEIGPLTDGM